MHSGLTTPVNWWGGFMWERFGAVCESGMKLLRYCLLTQTTDIGSHVCTYAQILTEKSSTRIDIYAHTHIAYLHAGSLNIT